MPSLTQDLAASLSKKPINQNDLEVAAQLTLDAVANAVAGRFSDQGRILLNWARGKPADTGRKSFVMGALTHILEVDDLHKASVTHPGCAVVPAAWALAKAQNSAGFDFLKAVIWGFEAMTRVGRAVGPGHYKNWHNTATCGPFGSAMAGAALLGLDEAQTVHALGNAGTQSAGFWEFLDTGAMSKHLHAGRAAEAGVVASELAQLGFTGPPQILEGPRGFFAATCPDPSPERVLEGLDGPWQVHETSIKPWPSCRHTHPGIHAARDLRAQIRASEIKAVRIGTYQAALDLCDRPDPNTVYAAKFSLQHCAAAALSQDNVEFDSFESAARSQFAALRGKISVHLDGDMERAYPRNWGTTVEVDLADGTKLSATKADALGDPELPMPREDLIAKAEMLLRHGGVSDPAPLIEAILELASDGPLPALPFDELA